MEIKGFIFEIQEEVSGATARGGWRKRSVVIETNDEYKRKVCISFWGDKADSVSNLTLGSTITAHINIESKEHNGRWFTEIKCWKLESETSTTAQAAPVYAAPAADDSDIPF